MTTAPPGERATRHAQRESERYHPGSSNLWRYARWIPWRIPL